MIKTAVLQQNAMLHEWQNSACFLMEVNFSLEVLPSLLGLQNEIFTVVFFSVCFDLAG